jgi:ABC-type phosphate transport system substrate-binding protein
MIKHRLHLFLIIISFIFNSPLLADKILVIVAKNSPIMGLTLQQLENIYRKKNQLNTNNERWVPINLIIEDPLRQAFSEEVFKQRPEEMESFWNIQYFNGIIPPYVVSSNEAVLRFVNSTPNAIGYIHHCYLDQRVQVIMKLDFKSSLSDSCP